MAFILPPQPPQPTFLGQLGAGLGAGIGQTLPEKIDQFIGQRRAQQERSRVQSMFNELGTDATIQDKMSILLQSNLSPESQKHGLELLRQQGAKDFAQKLSEGEDISLPKLIEGTALGYIPPGIGQELARPFAKDPLQQSYLQELFGTQPSAQPSIEEAPPTEEVVPSRQPRSIRDFDEDKLSKMIAIGGNIGKAAQAEFDRRKLQQQVTERHREFAYKRAGKYLERADTLRETLPVKENALNQMKAAITDGDLSFFSRDNFANMTGMELFRTAKGAAFINAGKEYFLGNIKRAGARPNQWIEQQIQKMLPQMGRNAQANMTVAELMQFETDMERERLNITDKLEDQFEITPGFVPANIARLVDKGLKPWITERQKELEVRLREIDKGQLTTKSIRMRDPAGQLREVPQNQAKEAQKAGYKLVQ